MKVIVEPKLEPVSISEVKTQLGIDDARSDDLIARRIKVAREHVELYTGRALLFQTREKRWDKFIDRHDLECASAVISIKYLDAEGVEQTMDSADYTLDTYPFIPHVRKAYGVTWPSIRSEPNAVRIQYTAGYGATASTVPATIIEAMLLYIGHLMNFQPQAENGILLTRMPWSVREKLDNYKLYI